MVLEPIATSERKRRMLKTLKTPRVLNARCPRQLAAYRGAVQKQEQTAEAHLPIEILPRK